MVNLNIKPGILFVIAQFICIGVSSNVLCLAFLKQHTPGLKCPIRKDKSRAWGCGSVVEYLPGVCETVHTISSTTRGGARICNGVKFLKS